MCTWSSTRTQRGMAPGTGISGAHSRGTAPKPMPRAAVAGNIETHVGRGREDDADDVVLDELVALHDLAQQLLDALGDLLGGVGIDGGGAAQGSDGGAPGIGRACYRGRRPAAASAARRSDGASPTACRGVRPSAPDSGAPRPRSAAASGPGRRRAVGERADPGAHQPAHRVADRLAHPAHLAVAALVDDDAQHPGRDQRPPWPARSGRRRARPPRAAGAGPRPTGVPSTSARYSLATPWRGVGQQLGQLPVVGEDQQALGLAGRAGRPGTPGARSGTSDDHRRPALRVAAVVTTPAGLFNR